LNPSIGELIFNWSPNPDVDLYGYEIREGDNWNEGVVIDTEILGTSYNYPVYENGEKRFMIKAIDTSFNYSNSESFFVIEITNLPIMDFIEPVDLSEWDLGFISGTSVLNSRYNLSGNAVNVINLSGTQIVDSTPQNVVLNELLGFIKSSEIESENVSNSLGELIVDSSGELVTNSEARTEFLELRYLDGFGYIDRASYISKIVDLGQVLAFMLAVETQIEADSGSWEIRIRTSNDNVTWGDWAIHSNGEYTCRYYQIKITVTSNVDEDPIRIFTLISKAYIRYKQDGGNDVTVSDTGDTTVSFNIDFYSKVRVYPIAQGTKYARVIQKNTSGDKIVSFDVKVFDDSSGLQVAGVIDWEAFGY
jgi:hypothetical protein